MLGLVTFQNKKTSNMETNSHVVNMSTTTCCVLLSVFGFSFFRRSMLFKFTNNQLLKEVELLTFPIQRRRNLLNVYPISLR